MKKQILQLRALYFGIWVCWLIACLTRNNWIICAVCAIGFVTNILFAKRADKPLQYIISGIFFLAVAIGNLYFIF